jgi:cytochrome b involved in lipid metabolism
MSTPSFSAEEVAKHNKASDCWVVVKGKVYDVTKFLEEHPGGKKILLNASGAVRFHRIDFFSLQTTN